MVVMSIEGRKIRKKRKEGRESKSWNVDKNLRILLVGKRKRIGKKKKEIGIGIEDLKGKKIEDLKNVEGEERIERDWVLYRGNEKEKK